MMSVRSCSCTKQFAIFRFAQMGRHRPARRRKFEPVISVTTTIEKERRASIGRFGEMTGTKLCIDVGKERRNIDIELPGHVFRSGRQYANGGFCSFKNLWS